MFHTLVLALQDSLPASAPTAAPASNAWWTQFALMGIIFAIFWFVMIGPERKNRKKREAMLAAMGKGDKVMTSGGLYGTIVQVQDDVVTLQVDEGVRLRFSRAAIQTVLAEDAAESNGSKAAKK
jgi:preprotein translocase subunit YajC